MDIASYDLCPLILESMAEGVFTVGSDFRITYFNTAAEAITGFSRTEAQGRKCYDIFRASVCQQGCPMKKSLETEEPQRNVNVTVLNVCMQEVPICVSCAVLRDQQGQMIGGVEIFRDMSEVESLRNQLSSHCETGDMIGISPAMRKICQLIPDLAASDTSVLIQGPSGTGKELVAKAIHDASPRSDHAFVRVNCGALPDTLLESELYGYVRGAFTDAKKNKSGRFQQAHKGTLFLDEVGDLSNAFQVKLLRVLQDGEVQPLGSTESTKFDVRIIAATNRNLKNLIEDQKFRDDLYYRISVFPIYVPPLRQRREDILPLLEHYVALLRTRTGKDIQGISADAIAVLYDFDYPGNIRQLINILERAFVLCHTKQIEMAHLPSEVVAPKTAWVDERSKTLEQPLKALIDDSMNTDSTHNVRLWQLKPSEHRLFSRQAQNDRQGETNLLPQITHLRPEAQQLVAILRSHSWNRGATADALGVSRSTLWRRMKEYGLSDQEAGTPNRKCFT